MRVIELSGAQLDWAVTQIEHPEYSECVTVEYSSEWDYGGPIIEREGIALYLYGDAEWNAHVGNKESTGPTPLVAAMRCYVVSRLGQEVELPEGLL